MLAAAAPAGAITLTATESSLLRSVNEIRAERFLGPVRMRAGLERAARAHSADMLAQGYFGHRGFPDRLFRVSKGNTVGEDLGWSKLDPDATGRIIRLWLASPKHREILLRPGFQSVGIGVARGAFMGWDDAIVVTADFAGA